MKEKGCILKQFAHSYLCEIYDAMYIWDIDWKMSTECKHNNLGR